MEELVARGLATTEATMVIVTLVMKLAKRIATCQTSTMSTEISTSSTSSISIASLEPEVAVVAEMDLVLATTRLPDTPSVLSS